MQSATLSSHMRPPHHKCLTSCYVYHAGTLIATAPFLMPPCLTGSLRFSQTFRSSENICSSGTICEVSMLDFQVSDCPSQSLLSFDLAACIRTLSHATCAHHVKALLRLCSGETAQSWSQSKQNDLVAYYPARAGRGAAHPGHRLPQRRAFQCSQLRPAGRPLP